MALWLDGEVERVAVRIRSRGGKRCHGAIVQGQDHVAVRVLRDGEVARLVGLDCGLGLSHSLGQERVMGYPGRLGERVGDRVKEPADVIVVVQGAAGAVLVDGGHLVPPIIIG